PEAESATASITGSSTVIVTIAVSQLVGLLRSEDCRVGEEGPAGVPTATSTEPLALRANSVSPLTCVRITSAGLTAALLRRSFVNTFTTFACPVYPLILLAESTTASITGSSTVIVTIAVSQLVGLLFSQIW